MKINKVYLLDKIKELIVRYYRRDTISNFYMREQELASFVEGGFLSASHSSENLLLFVEKERGTRVYFFLNDLGEELDFGGTHNLVMEILFKSDIGVPCEIVKYWERQGFSENLVRDQYSGVYKNLTLYGEKERPNIMWAADLSEVRCACELFNGTFDELSGDYVPSGEFEGLLHGKQILIARSNEGTFLGALHLTRDRSVSWLSHIAVCPEARGRGVGTALVDEFIERGKENDRSRYMLWVQRQNVAAVRMYHAKGFVPTNKSTLSLIKK